MIVTRFAPSPTGYLHLGHAYAALCAARAGERFLLRIEDLDRARTREEFVTAIFEDLKWLGIAWEGEVVRQSARFAAYRAALQRLEPFTYPCFCTRKEIEAEIARAVEAPPAQARLPVYPGTCLRLSAQERARRIQAGDAHAIRLDAAKAGEATGPLSFVEHGQVHKVDPLLFGDVVLARKDMPASYHLAVVVDDAAQDVTLVTRGEDLLPATHVQRMLQALLACPAPAYAHHTLVLDDQGRKYSKRDQAVTLRSLRAKGIAPKSVEALIAGRLAAAEMARRK